MQKKKKKLQEIAETFSRIFIKTLKDYIVKDDQRLKVFLWIWTSIWSSIWTSY